MYRKSSYDSPIGQITLATDDDHLVGLWLDGHKYLGQLGTTTPNALVAVDEQGQSRVARATRDWLDRYFAGERPDPGELPLRPMGSEFRQQVWAQLLQIGYGEVASYQQIGLELGARRGRPTASRAVGGAVGHNPISIIIPCHRVIGADGSLTGYASGLAHKIALLELEGVDLSKMKIPTHGTAL